MGFQELGRKGPGRTFRHLSAADREGWMYNPSAVSYSNLFRLRNVRFETIEIQNGYGVLNAFRNGQAPFQPSSAVSPDQFLFPGEIDLDGSAFSPSLPGVLCISHDRAGSRIHSGSGLYPHGVEGVYDGIGPGPQDMAAGAVAVVDGLECGRASRNSAPAYIVGKALSSASFQDARSIRQARGGKGDRQKVYKERNGPHAEEHEGGLGGR